MDKKNKSKIAKVFKVGIIPTISMTLLITGIVAPTIIFSTNAVGRTTEKSRIESMKQYSSIYHQPFKESMKMGIDTSIGKFNVNGKLSDVWKITKKGHSNDPVTKAMIFVHGLRNSHWNSITFAKQMIDRGYVVYSYDQREAGENINNGKISFGQNEAGDLNNLYKKIVSSKNNKSLKELIIYGQSNGAGTTLSFGEKYQSSINDAKQHGVSTSFMIESGFVSAHSAMNGLIQGAVKGGKILSLFVTPQMRNSVNQFMAITNDYNYADNINKIKQRLYIAHGDKDKIIPVEQGRELANARTDKRNTIYHEWKGLGHIGISLARKSQDQLFEEAIPFLETGKKHVEEIY